jgi:hypothetical protein
MPGVLEVPSETSRLRFEYSIKLITTTLAYQSSRTTDISPPRIHHRGITTIAIHEQNNSTSLQSQQTSSIMKIAAATTLFLATLALAKTKTGKGNGTGGASTGAAVAITPSCALQMGALSLGVLELVRLWE